MLFLLLILMYFSFVKRLDTNPNSIFYSLIEYQNGNILAVGRRRYDERIIKYMLLDTSLNIIKDNHTFLLRGEDPRCFYHKNNLYIQDNYWNDMYLLNLTKKEDHKINIDGKNLSFISHNGRLYFIHLMCPFSLFEMDLETNEIFPVDVYKQDFYNFEYRGGTPGYKLNDNTYYGFGHRTYIYVNTMIHDVFYWEVHFAFDKPFIKIWNIEQPPDSLNICDPTSIIKINNKHYLITAESNFPWFQDQDYETNIYEIIWDNEL